MAIKKKKDSLVKVLKAKIKDELFSAQGLPLALAFTTLAVLFVLFRMKGVELDYKISEINASIEDATSENKDLRASKARLLSTGNIRLLAQKHGLAQPKQEQIIVIR